MIDAHVTCDCYLNNRTHEWKRARRCEFYPRIYPNKKPLATKRAVFKIVLQTINCTRTRPLRWSSAICKVVCERKPSTGIYERREPHP
jgi:hypothetical protein